MATIPHSARPDRASGPHGRRLWCTVCDTDEHLIIESIDSLRPPNLKMVDVAYTCGECDYFYAHPADVFQVADVLNRPGQVSGVLQFGGQYLHCGQPMTTAGSGHRSIYAPVTTETSGEDPLDVYLRTRVLRCACGFRMEIPD
jgi:hypothetical protein